MPQRFDDKTDEYAMDFGMTDLSAPVQFQIN
jgi:hypothetical protein